MAEPFELSYWPATDAPESKLSHTATTHHGFVPKISHHGGKNTVPFHYTEKGAVNYPRISRMQEDKLFYVFVNNSNNRK